MNNLLRGIFEYFRDNILGYEEVLELEVIAVVGNDEDLFLILTLIGIGKQDLVEK